MKKILAGVICTIMLLTMLALPTAAQSTNVGLDISYTATAPTIDGVVSPNEYGLFPTHEYSVTETNDEFLLAHNDYTSDFSYEFYITWDYTNLYMAWVVNTPVHATFDVDYKDPSHPTNNGNMWMYSCIQFMLSPSAPKEGTTTFQEGEYAGNYLEIGLSVPATKVSWCTPNDATGLTTDDWDFKGVRDDANNTTTYEVSIPWNKTGVGTIEDGTQFGLTYAVAAQEYYDTKKGMIEWQDAILGGKKMDSAGVITLTGGEDTNPGESSVVVGSDDPTPPAEGDWIEIEDTKFNATPAAGEIALVTKSTLYESYYTGVKDALLIRAEKGDDYFTIAEIVEGDGDAVPTFKAAPAADDIVLIVRADHEFFDAYKQLAEGDAIALFGIDGVNITNEPYAVYTNAELSFEPDEESSEAEPSETEPSETESSDTESKTTSSTTSSAGTSSSSTPDEESSMLWLWIVIGAVVVVAIVVVVIIVVKKKKK